MRNLHSIFYAISLIRQLRDLSLPWRASFAFLVSCFSFIEIPRGIDLKQRSVNGIESDEIYVWQRKSLKYRLCSGQSMAGNLPLLARLSWSKFVPTNDGHSLCCWNISLVAATVQTKLPLSTVDMSLQNKVYDGRWKSVVNNFPCREKHVTWIANR